MENGRSEAVPQQRSPRRYVPTKMPQVLPQLNASLGGGYKNLSDQLQTLGEMIGDLSLMKQSTKELWKKGVFPFLKRRLKLKFGVFPPTMEPQIFNKDNEKGWKLYVTLLRQHRDYWNLEDMEGIDLEKVLAEFLIQSRSLGIGYLVK